MNGYCLYLTPVLDPRFSSPHETSGSSLAIVTVILLLESNERRLVIFSFKQEEC